MASHIEMGKEIITFGETKTEKHEFQPHKNPIFLEDVDIGNVLVSDKITSSEKKLNTLLVTWIMIIKLSHYT